MPNHLILTYSSSGKNTLNTTAPDTITSWAISGFSIDAATGIAFTAHPKRLTVFKPFFISLDLPYSIKLGETVAISVTVFNYLGHKVKNAELTLYNEENAFKFVGHYSDDDGSGKLKKL